MLINICDASKRHYLINPTLSDNGAQCGGLRIAAKKASRRDATSQTIRGLRVSDTLMLCRIFSPHTAPVAAPFGRALYGLVWGY